VVQAVRAELVVQVVREQQLRKETPGLELTTREAITMMTFT
jgi:hypothetical protein